MFCTITFSFFSTENRIEAYRFIVILLLMPAIHVQSFRRIHGMIVSVILIWLKGTAWLPWEMWELGVGEGFSVYNFISVWPIKAIMASYRDLQQTIIDEHISLCVKISIHLHLEHIQMCSICLKEWMLLTYFWMEARKIYFRDTFVSVGYTHYMYISKDKFYQYW